ncbi:unnamed protein product [Adineta steineri]|uniref:TLC domain-containing protein n=1 Tax=Adineta steineri TaxID=433720 RepID=A0A813PEE4_9BILA|nr:unnamed protein product [Adineta steineri]CAF4144688.1 unnamed protein product [Adineta steineri]
MKFCDKVKNERYYQKVILYNLLNFYEIVFTVLITACCLPDVVLFLFKNELLLRTRTVSIAYLSGIVFWTLYAYEMVLNYKDPLNQIRKKQIPQLTIHHITALIRITIANICLRFSSSDDFVVKCLICYVYSIGMYHATLDYIMHIPLLLWRLDLFYKVRSVFFWFSYWPLLVIRCFIYAAIITIYICFRVRQYHLSTFAYVWIVSHIILLVIQFIVQVIGSLLMKKIHIRDKGQHRLKTDAIECDDWSRTNLLEPLP